MPCSPARAAVLRRPARARRGRPAGPRRRPRLRSRRADPGPRGPVARRAVVGIDSSPQMLERARTLDTGGRVRWQQAGRRGLGRDVGRGERPGRPSRHRRARHECDAPVGAEPPAPRADLARRARPGRHLRPAGARELRRALAPADGARSPPVTRAPPTSRRDSTRPGGGTARDVCRPAPRADATRRPCGRRPTSTCWRPTRTGRTRCSNGCAGTACGRSSGARGGGTGEIFLSDYEQALEMAYPRRDFGGALPPSRGPSRGRMPA